MPRYLIERALPGAGKLTPAELQGIAQKSNEVLSGMGGRAHGGFPVTQIRQIGTVIDAGTADA